MPKRLYPSGFWAGLTLLCAGLWGWDLIGNAWAMLVVLVGALLVLSAIVEQLWNS